MTTLTEEQRREATKAVLEWMTETCGFDVARDWAWCHTPLPCGLPLDDQLEQGLLWASLGREAALPLMAANRAKISREEDEAMAAYRAEREAQEQASAR